MLLVSACGCAAAGAATTEASAAAGPARARPTSRIILNTSIGGIGLGATPRQIERRLGRPGQTIHVAHRIASLTYYNYGLAFDFDTLQPTDPADDVAALGPPGAPAGVRYRTSKGVHVGSSVARVKHSYRGMRCDRYQCELYRGAPGAVGTRSTTFTFFAGKVSSIQVQKIDE